MLIFLILYFGVIIGLRSYILFKQTKVNPIKNFGVKSKHAKAERLIQIGLFLLIVIALNFCFLNSNYKYFFPFIALEISWLNLFGFLISIVGLIVTFIAQIQMRGSWRLGIDKENDLSLVTTGMYKFSRNPVYIGLGISFIGFFLIAPNLGSTLFLLIMAVAISIKIKDEEKFLKQNIPDEYHDYCQKVKRWI